jgi:hypothetical protein
VYDGEPLLPIVGCIRYTYTMGKRGGAIGVVAAVLGLPAAASAQFISGGGGSSTTVQISNSGITTFVSALLAGALGWVALEFFGRPLRKFFDLRGEIIRQLVRFANVRPRYTPITDRTGKVIPVDQMLSDAERQRLTLAMDTFRDLGSQMSAFANNETFALRAAKTFGYDPALASSSLIGLSNSIDTHGAPERILNRTALAKALKLKPGMP